MFMKIKAAIFDLDGVIADSEPFSEKADEIVLARHGIFKTEKEKHEAFGRRTEEIFGDVLKARNIDLSTERLIEEKDHVFTGLIKGNLKLIRNSLELIDFFKRKGFKLALATSSHRKKMTAELRELGTEDLFRTIITGDDVKKGKPNPEIYLRAARALGVRPEESAVIEDSGFGVLAGKNAGMFTIGFRSPNSRGQDISRADLIIDDLAEVIDYFSRG